MTDSLTDQIVHELATEHYRLMRYFVAGGCQVCGKPVTQAAVGETLHLELEDSGTGEVKVKVTESVAVRCGQHPLPGRPQ